MADNFNADDLVRIKDVVKITGATLDTKLIRYLDRRGRRMVRDLAPYATVAFSDTDDDLKDLEAMLAGCDYIRDNRMVVDDSGRERKHSVCAEAEAAWDAYIKDKYVTTERPLGTPIRHSKTHRKM